MSMRPSISINLTSPPAYRGLQYALFAYFYFFIHTEKTFVSISREPDQAPHSATPDLSLNCLHVLRKGGLIFFITHINIHTLLQTAMYHQ